jgi:hypothetical protein
MQLQSGVRAIWPLVLLAVACGDGSDSGAFARPACSIVLDSVATLGPGSGSLGPSLGSTALRLPTGRFLVGEGYTPGVVAQFEADGSFAGSFGRPGEGPGEFRRTSELRVSEGRVFINDQTLRRISEVTLDGEFVGIASSSLGTGPFAPLEDGTVLLVTGSNSAEERTFQKVRGRVARESFDVRSDVFSSGPWYLVDHGDSTFWIASVTRYLIERWTDQGRRVIRIERTLDWFPERSLYQADPHVERFPFSGRISEIKPGLDGTLNVLLHQYDRAAQAQLAAAARATPAGGDVEMSFVEPETALTAVQPVIHVISQRDGSLIADTTIADRAFAGFADANHAYARSMGPEGVPQLDVFRMTLVNHNDGGDCK